MSRHIPDGSLITPSHDSVITPERWLAFDSFSICRIGWDRRLPRLLMHLGRRASGPWSPDWLLEEAVELMRSTSRNRSRSVRRARNGQMRRSPLRASCCSCVCSRRNDTVRPSASQRTQHSAHSLHATGTCHRIATCPGIKCRCSCCNTEATTASTLVRKAATRISHDTLILSETSQHRCKTTLLQAARSERNTLFNLFLH